MFNWQSLENFFQGKRNISLLFVFLIGLQFVYSFFSPSFADTYYWRKISDLNFYQGFSFDVFDNSLVQKIQPLIEKYRLNLDGAGYLLLAHNFPQYYFEGNLTFLARPLYPVLVNLAARPLHLISNSYSMTFAAGLLMNFILFFFTVYLFFCLVKKLVSFRVAIISALLLIFSPFSHVWLIQPETNIFGIFSIILSLYLLHRYSINPSLKKLVIFALIVGLLMLGKKIFAIGIFVLLLAFFFKRYKEGIVFFILHLIPLFLWSLWVKQVWGLSFYVDEVANFDYGLWLLNIFVWPWHQSLQIFMQAVPKFITTVSEGFLLIPLIFSLIGYQKLVLARKNIIVFSFLFSFFILLFGMNVYLSRFGFWLFPLIYPLAVLGIDEAANFLKKYKPWYASAFQVLIYCLIVFISSLNIYQFVYYG